MWMRTNDQQSLMLRGQDNGYYVGAYRDLPFYHSNVGTPTMYINNVVTTQPNTIHTTDVNVYHMWEASGCNFGANLWSEYGINNYGSYQFTNGAIAIFMMYNRVLSRQESQQIYNALGRRFGK